MRRKTWSTHEAPDTLRVQALREMMVSGGEGGLGIGGGEGGADLNGGEGSVTDPRLMAAVRSAGGEGGGSPG